MLKTATAQTLNTGEYLLFRKQLARISQRVSEYVRNSTKITTETVRFHYPQCFGARYLRDPLYRIGGRLRSSYMYLHTFCLKIGKRRDF